MSENPVTYHRTFDTGEEWLYLYCPGCELVHIPVVGGKDHAWGWNKSSDKPTLSPSILVTYSYGEKKVRCHSFVINGEWKFLSDCTHEYAGQTIPLPPLPDWCRGE